MESEQHIIFTGQTDSRGTADDSGLSAQMLPLSADRRGRTQGLHCLVRYNKDNFPEHAFPLRCVYGTKLEPTQKGEDQ